MWSDRHRGWKLLLLLAVLVLFGQRHAAAVRALPVGWNRALGDPAAYDGRVLILSLYSVSAVVPGDAAGEGRVFLSKVVRQVPVVGVEDLVAGGLAEGDTVSVRGRFRAADKVVVAEEAVVHRWRRAKHLLSLIGLVGGLILSPLVFAWRGGRLVVRG